MKPTLDTIIAAVGGRPSKDGQNVVVSYGSNGYLRLYPSTVIMSHEQGEVAAVRIDGKLARQNGGSQAELRAKLRAAGIEIR